MNWPASPRWRTVPVMEGAVVYRFRIALRQISPKIWRRLELTPASSLADLQRAIQITMGWSDEYQHRFCIRQHSLGTSRPGGLLLCGDPKEMKLSQFAFRANERFTYDYNFFDAWLFDVRFEGEQPLDPKYTYPRCIAGARRAPPEDIGGAEVFMDRQPPALRQVRKVRRVEQTLRRLAELLEDPALDDSTLRARSTSCTTTSTPIVT